MSDLAIKYKVKDVRLQFYKSIIKFLSDRRLYITKLYFPVIIHDVKDKRRTALKYNALSMLTLNNSVNGNDKYIYVIIITDIYIYILLLFYFS